MLLLPEAVVATMTQMFLSGLITVCRAIKKVCEISSSLFNSLQRGAATCDGLVQLCWLRCKDWRIATTGWECHRTTLYVNGKIPRIMRSINYVSRSILTTILWAFPNHSLTHKSPRWTSRSIAPSVRNGSWRAVRRWGTFLRLVRLIDCGEWSDWLTRLVPVPALRRHVAVGVDAALMA